MIIASIAGVLIACLAAALVTQPGDTDRKPNTSKNSGSATATAPGSATTSGGVAVPRSDPSRSLIERVSERFKCVSGPDVVRDELGVVVGSCELASGATLTVEPIPSAAYQEGEDRFADLRESLPVTRDGCRGSDREPPIAGKRQLYCVRSEGDNPDEAAALWSWTGDGGGDYIGLLRSTDGTADIEDLVREFCAAYPDCR